MLRKALLGLVLTAGIAFAGEKGQAPKAQAPVAPAAPVAKETPKAQAPAAPIKLVSKKEIIREYVPVQRRNRLTLRQVGVNKTQTCTNCVDCTNCKK
jgi:hypothetical protein